MQELELNQEDKSRELSENEGTILKNLNKETANNFANQFRYLTFQVAGLE